MLNLVAIDFGYKISTTDLQLIYTESGGVKIEVGAIPLTSSDECRNIEIAFSLVAEAKCVTMNFYESNYSLIDRTLKAIGFYEVENSQHLQENINIYDTQKRYDFRHYIIAGYDGYVELIASSQYSVNEKPLKQ